MVAGPIRATAAAAGLGRLAAEAPGPPPTAGAGGGGEGGPSDSDSQGGGSGGDAPVTQAATSLPRPWLLAVRPGDANLQHMRSCPHLQLAFAMGMHCHLGETCSFKRMDSNVL